MGEKITGVTLVEEKNEAERAFHELSGNRDVAVAQWYQISTRLHLIAGSTGLYRQREGGLSQDSVSRRIGVRNF
jgi:hypothetical protein